MCQRQLNETPLHPSRASSRPYSVGTGRVGGEEHSEYGEYSEYSEHSKHAEHSEHSEYSEHAKHTEHGSEGMGDASAAQPVLAARRLVHPAGVQLRGGERSGCGREGRVTSRYGGTVSAQRRRGEEPDADAARGGRIVS